MAAAYDFSGVKTVVEVGAPPAACWRRSCRVIGGRATRGDVYTLSHIIHDWTEAQCLTILGHVRKAMPDHGWL